ncbi:hypothetical protein N7466_004077, partial [Penicillium verhagenii]|uniref:uncharacterized protein n=1 Tax=Penicillium verhagenii TaxID=1562060 RepID=UPI002545096A
IENEQEVNEASKRPDNQAFPQLPPHCHSDCAWRRSGLQMRASEALPLSYKTAGWPNGKALDYESRDCRFDPCVGQSFCVFVFVSFSSNIFLLTLTQ